MTDGDGTQARLGTLVRDQRVALGMSVRAAAKKAGVDRATWSGLEDGSRVTQDRHYTGIERALGWAAGSILAILAGGKPTIIIDTHAPRQRRMRKPLDPLTSSPEEIAEFLEEVRERFGEEEYRELYEGTLEVRRLAAERERKARTRNDV